MKTYAGWKFTNKWGTKDLSSLIWLLLFIICLVTLEMIVQGNFSDDVNYSIWNKLYNNSVYEPFSPVDGHWHSDSRDIVQGIFLLVFTVIGTAFNVFMIVAIVPNRRLRTVRNILLVHLGSAGLASSILTIFYSSLIRFTGVWIGGKIVCQFYGFFQSTLTMVTIWTIAALSWDKYQTIASPLHHSLTATARKMTSLFCVFWVVALICALPPIVGGEGHVFHWIQGTCFVNHFNVGGRWYISMLFLVMFYLPLIVMLYCYAHIFRIARTQSSRIAATMMRMACVVQAPITLNSQSTNLTSSSSSIKGTKAMLTILQLVGAFAIIYLPYSVVILYETSQGKESVHYIITSIATTLFQAAPMTNGAVYGIRNKILRNSFYRYAHRRFQHLCYKDKRRGSVKRSSSFRMSLMQRKLHQNGSISQGLRRTQSLQAKHLNPPLQSLLKVDTTDGVIKKAHSFTGMANGHALKLIEPIDIPNGSKDISNDSVSPLEPLMEYSQPKDNLSIPTLNQVQCYD